MPGYWRLLMIDIFSSHAVRAFQTVRSTQIITSSTEHAALLSLLTTVTKPVVISFINAHAFNLVWKHPAFAANLPHSDVLLRDGIGISLLMRALGMDPGLDMNGTDFIPFIVRAFVAKRVALCGTAEPHLTEAAVAVRRLGGEVVLAIDGFREYAVYVEQIACAGADLVILGMGMPKQEAVAAKLARELNGPLVIVNGGAILDFWANRFPRAPFAWRRLRLEWLFRLIHEPRRLWRRYLFGGIVFAVRVAQLRLISPVLEARGIVSVDSSQLL